MLTLRDLTAGGDPLLTYLSSAPSSDDEHVVRSVEQAEVCDADGTAPRSLRPGALAVLPPEACRRGARADDVVRVLNAQGAAVVVLAGPGHEPPDPDTVFALADAATAVRLPLLVPVRPAPAWHVVASVRTARHRAAAAHAGRLAGLMQCVDRLYREGQGPEGLLAHLGEATDAGMYLAVPGSTGWRLLADDGCESALRGAHRDGIGGTVRTEGGRHVLLAPVGDRSPYPVLAGVRGRDDGPWAAHLRETLRLAATQAALLERHGGRRQHEETQRSGRRAARSSVVQALALGRVEQALRLAAAQPGLQLTGGSAVLAVVSCAPAQREELTVVCEDGLPHALVVPCPSFSDQVLVVAPALDADGHALEAVLREVLAGHDHQGVGMSGPQPWNRMANAYALARRALSTAGSGQITSRPGGIALAAALAAVPGALGWARRVRARTDVEDVRRMGLARLALTAGIPGAAALTGSTRRDVRQALTGVLDGLGLDHREVCHRAVAELAFQLADAADAADAAEGADGTGGPGGTGGTIGVLTDLRSLTDGDAARRWAEAVLMPLQTTAPPVGGWLGPRTPPGPQDALDLAVLYVTCGASVTATATGLALNTRATRARLTALAAALGRPLHDPVGAGPHDVVWALLITGRLPSHLVPDPGGSLGDPRPFVPRQMTPAG